MKHGGNGSAYSYNKCRCVECTEANRLRSVRRRAERHAEPKHPNDPRHGLATFYDNHGCRCDKCKAASSIRRQRVNAQRKARTA